MIFNQIGSSHRVKKNNAWNHHLDYSSWRQSKPRAPQSAVVNAMKTAPNTPGNTRSHDAVVISKGHKEYTIWSMHFNMDKNGRMTTWKKNSICSFFNVERLSSINSLDHEEKVNIVVVGESTGVKKKEDETKVSHHVHHDNTKFKPCTITRLPIVAATGLGGSESRSLHTRTPRKGKARHYHCVTEISWHHDIMQWKTSMQTLFFCERNNPVNKWIITFQISSMLPLPFAACHLKCSQ